MSGFPILNKAIILGCLYLRLSNLYLFQSLFLLLFSCSALCTSIVSAVAELLVGPSMDKFINAKQKHQEQQLELYKTRETWSLPKNDLIGWSKEFVMNWLKNPSNEEHQTLITGTDLYRNNSLLSIVIILITHLLSFAGLLDGWKAHLLSFAGRLQFLRCTIYNTLAYWLRGIIIPKAGIKFINQIDEDIDKRFR